MEGEAVMEEQWGLWSAKREEFRDEGFTPNGLLSIFSRFVWIPCQLRLFVVGFSSALSAPPRENSVLFSSHHPAFPSPVDMTFVSRRGCVTDWRWVA